MGLYRHGIIEREWTSIPFIEATEKADILSGDNPSVLFGKIKKNSKVIDEQLAQIATQKADITYVNTQVQNMNAQVQGFYETVALLTTAFPSGNTNNYVVTGVKEIDTLTVTAVPTVAGNITITLNGTAFTIALTLAMITTDLVATAIRNTSFIGWTTGGTGSVVTFTKQSPVVCSAPVFSAGSTGSTATFAVTTAGTASNFYIYRWSGTTWVSTGYIWNSNGIADSSIATEKYIDKSVSPNKANFIEVTGNLLNPDEVLFGKFLNTNGIVENNSYGWGVSGFILVTEGSTYAATSVSYSYYYDANKVKVSDIPSATFTVPVGVRYVRFSISAASTTYNNSFMVMCASALPTTYYVPYRQSVKYPAKVSSVDAAVIGTPELKEKAVYPRKTSFFSSDPNLFYYSTLEANTTINIGSGKEETTANSYYCTSEFIAVDASKNYGINTPAFRFYYDNSKNYLGYNQLSTGVVFQPITNTAFMKFVFTLASDVTDQKAYVVQSDSIPTEATAVPKILTKYLPSSWVGYKLTTEGDSITAQAKWQTPVCNALGLNLIANTAIGGTNVALVGETEETADDTAMCSWNRINQIPSDTELLFLMGGANDWWNSVPMGSIMPFGSTFDPTTFYGAYQQWLERLYQRVPNARVVILLHTYRAQMVGRYNGFVLEDYREAVRKIANKYGYPTVNCLDAGINELNYTTYLQDVVHPNDAGGIRLSEVIIGRMKTLEPIIA